MANKLIKTYSFVGASVINKEPLPTFQERSKSSFQIYDEREVQIPSLLDISLKESDLLAMDDKSLIDLNFLENEGLDLSASAEKLINMLDESFKSPHFNRDRELF